MEHKILIERSLHQDIIHPWQFLTEDPLQDPPMVIDLLPGFSNQEVVDTPPEVGVEQVGEGHEYFAEHYEVLVGLVEVEVSSELGDVLDDVQQLIQQSKGVGQSIHDILALE